VTRTQNYRWMQRIYKLLQDPETRVALRKFKPTIEGIAYSELQLMYIDPRRNFLSTLIHECLHLLLPDSPLDTNDGECSKQVLRLEEQIVNSLSDRQWKNLIFRIGNKLW